MITEVHPLFYINQLQLKYCGEIMRKTFKINNINGQAYDTGAARTATSLYWRATHKNAPHNAYTNIPSIKQIAKDRGYSLTTDQESVLNYVEEEVVLDGENAQVANTITIPYSSNHKVKYEYLEDSKECSTILTEFLTDMHITKKQLMDRLKINRESTGKGHINNERSKPVAQIDKYTGEVIRIFANGYEVERELGSNFRNTGVNTCCNGKAKSYKGYRWEFVANL